MSNDFETPDEILDKFINLKPEDEGPELEADISARSEYADSMSAISDFLKWVVKTADDQAKMQGYPGTGKVPPEKLGELFSIVAERNAPEKLIKKAPEAAAVSITLGIIGMNFAHYRKQQIAAAQQAQKESENREEN